MFSTGELILLSGSVYTRARACRHVISLSFISLPFRFFLKKLIRVMVNNDAKKIRTITHYRCSLPRYFHNETTSSKTNHTVVTLFNGDSARAYLGTSPLRKVTAVWFQAVDFQKHYCVSLAVSRVNKTTIRRSPLCFFL